MTVDWKTHNLGGKFTWTSSYWAMIVFASTIGASTILFSLGIDWVMHGIRRPMYASDWIEAAAVAFISAVFLVRLQARRRELMVRMQIVEDVNHHVRNALTSIVLSASLREDSELNASVRDACDRIDWVLSDVLSQSVDATALRAEHPVWNAGRRLSHLNPPDRSP